MAKEAAKLRSSEEENNERILALSIIMRLWVAVVKPHVGVRQALKSSFDFGADRFDFL